MVDVAMPAPVSFDDPGFDAFVVELTPHLERHPPENAEEDLSDLVNLPIEFLGSGFLAGIETGGLSGRNRLSLLRARVRSQSHAQALVYEDMAAIFDACSNVDDTELAWDAASAEIRAALRLTRRAADHELDVALSLRDRLPMVLESLKAGEIDQRRAVVIVQGTSHLTAAQAGAVANEILETAGRCTTGQLRERVRRVALEIDPDSAAERYREAADRRRLLL